MSQHPRLAYLLLAAGGATRFGSCKQLALIDFKKSLLEHTLNTALDVAPGELELILGAYHVDICQKLNFKKDFSRVKVITNTQWKLGLGCSIAIGMNDIKASDYDGVMVMLADQVAIRSEQLKGLRESWYKHPDKIVASQFGDTLGPPAIFPNSYCKQLSELHGDSGAKNLIHNALNDVIKMPLPEAAIDIDTENQLCEWQMDNLL